jgi:hypothetical protein
MVLLLAPSRCWLAFGADPLRAVPGPGGLGAGDVDGVGHAVVLAGLPDDEVGVVLAAVMDGPRTPKARAASRCWTSWWPMPWERLAGR